MNKAVKIILGIVITFFTLVLSGVLGIEMTLFFDFPPGFFNQIIILFLASILIYFFNKKGIINFQIGKITIKNIILPIILTISLLIIAEVIFSKVLGYEVDEHFASSSMSSIQIFFIVVILGSISEELLFRGFLQNMLEPIKSYGIKISKIKLSLPVLISGLLFGIMHFGLLTMGASFSFVMRIVLSAAILGMIAGYFQEKQKNFTIALIVHVTANVMGLIM